MQTFVWTGLLTAIVLLLAITSVSWIQFREVKIAQSWVEHTQEVSLLLEQILRSFNDAETGQRGYLLTGDADYLEPFDAASKINQSLIAELRQLTADNPNQQARIEILEEIGSRKMAELSQTVRLHRLGQHDEAIKIVRSSLGRRLMSQLRELIAEMEKEEITLYDRRIAKRNRLSDSWQRTTGWLSVIASGVILAMGWWTTHRLREQYRQLRVFDEVNRLNDELEQFTRAACHDLRSPLRGIANAATVIREEDGIRLSDVSRDCLRMLETRVVRMIRLLDDLYQYSRAGTGSDGLERVDVAKLVREIEQTIERPDGFEIRLVGEFPTLHTRVAPLRLIFQNLIDNAIKHHDKDSGVIEVAASDRGELIEFTVSDNGPGIPAEFRDRVFEIFQTLKTRDELDSSGIGLSMLQKEVHRAGGKVFLADNHPRGVRFHFTWPKVGFE